MHDSLEADLIAAHRLPFARDRATWIDAYVGSASRLCPSAEPASVVAAAERAWCTQAWAHPAIVAHLEHWHGPFDDG